MRSFRVKGIVIKRRNFLEKDRILTLFTLEKGKIEALAKGARRPGNRLGPNSDLGSVAKFFIHKAKSLDIILEIEPIYHPFGARGEFDKTQKISYALKIIDKLFEEEEPHPKTFQVLLGLVKSVSDDERQLVFLKFLIEVLHDLGALPNFFKCFACHKSVDSKDEFVFGLSGGLTHLKCSEEHHLEVSNKEIKLLRLISSLKLEEISTYKVQKKVFEKAYSTITEYISYQFGKILPDEVM